MPENHFNCAVGAYTHNITLSPDREPETGLTLNMMFDLGYVRPEEVPQIPRLPKQPAAVVYSLLGDVWKVFFAAFWADAAARFKVSPGRSKNERWL